MIKKDRSKEEIEIYQQIGKTEDLIEKEKIFVNDIVQFLPNKNHHNEIMACLESSNYKIEELRKELKHLYNSIDL